MNTRGIPVRRVDVHMDTSKGKVSKPIEETKNYEIERIYRSEQLKRTSENSFIKSHIMESYVQTVEDNNTFKNKNTVSIGDAIKDVMKPTPGSTPKEEPAKVETISTNNVKKLNLRNGRSKFQETLVGGMLKNPAQLSRARSEYQDNPEGGKISRPFSGIVKMNFISPALSVYKSELGNAILNNMLSNTGSEQEFGQENSSRIASSVQKVTSSTVEEDLNVSQESRKKNASIDLDFEDINNLLPFDDRPLNNN